MIHVLKPLENSQDMEEKYQTKLLSYNDLKEKAEKEMSEVRIPIIRYKMQMKNLDLFDFFVMLQIQSKVQAVQMQYNSRLELAIEKFEALQNLEKTTGSSLIYSKKGKPMSDKVCI